jgi:drug/metabolite transporter (DMT)-like permease
MSIEYNKFKGTVLILSSSVLYSITACLIKVGSDLGAYRSTFGRFAVGLIILLLLAGSGRIKLRFTNKPLLIARGLIGSAVLCVAVLAIIKIGIGKGTVIMFTYPVYASLFGALLLKEKLKVANLFSLLFAMVGLYFLVIESNGVDGGFGLGRYEMLTAIAAAFGGLVVVIIRKLHETESSFEIYFAQCFFGMILLLVPAGIQGGSVSSGDFLVLIGIGVCATVGQLLMTEGFRYLPVKTASVLAMVELVANYTLGVIIFHEVLSLRSLAGSLMVAAGCVLALSVKKEAVTQKSCDKSE